jgi:uncharacterized phage protein gp47/JayE
MAGVTLTGFVAKTITDLTNDLNAAWRRVFGAQVNVDARSRNGQVIGILAGASAELWQLAETVAGALDPTSAGSVLLDNLCALTGTTRKAATASTTILGMVGVVGTVIPVGSKVAVPGSSKTWSTQGAPVVLGAVAAWVGSNNYGTGAVVVASGGQIWVSLTGGVSGVTPPTGLGPTFNDGGIVWNWLGTGAGGGSCNALCDSTGPVPAFAFTLTDIRTPVAGWNNAGNLIDAVLGRNLELDSQLRIRRQQEVAGIGSAQIDAMRVKVSKVAGVTFCKAYENPTDATVGGIPPHSTEFLVDGGAANDIAQALFDGGAGGIQCYGTSAGTATDTEGRTWSRGFSRITLHNTWVAVALEVDPDTFPLDGVAQVQQKIAAAGNGGGPGRDIVPSVLQAACFPVYDANGVLVAGVPGVLDVTAATLVGLANPPASTAPIAMSVRERAVYDTTRVFVTVTNGVP